MTPIQILEREIGHLRNGLASAIVNRREHPSYGYTKRDIQERLAVLEGALFAWHIITSGEGHAAPHLAALHAATALGINLPTLREQVVAC